MKPDPHGNVVPADDFKYAVLAILAGSATTNNVQASTTSKTTLAVRHNLAGRRDAISATSADALPSKIRLNVVIPIVRQAAASSTTTGTGALTDYVTYSFKKSGDGSLSIWLTVDGKRMTKKKAILYNEVSRAYFFWIGDHVDLLQVSPRSDSIDSQLLAYILGGPSSSKSGFGTVKAIRKPSGGYNLRVSYSSDRHPDVYEAISARIKADFDSLTPESETDTKSTAETRWTSATAKKPNTEEKEEKEEKGGKHTSLLKELENELNEILKAAMTTFDFESESFPGLTLQNELRLKRFLSSVVDGIKTNEVAPTNKKDHPLLQFWSAFERATGSYPDTRIYVEDLLNKGGELAKDLRRVLQF